MASGVSLSSSVCPSKVSAENAEEKTCSICLQSLEDKVHTLACNHIFHEGCIQEWLIIQKSCPICRFVVQVLPEEGPLPQGASGSEAPNVSDLAPEASHSGASYSSWGGGVGFGPVSRMSAMAFLVASGVPPHTAMMYVGMSFPPPPF